MGFFKAYDMRGTFGVDFDLTTVYKVGKALPSVVARQQSNTQLPTPLTTQHLNTSTSQHPNTTPRWLVGRDCRVTSTDVHDALVQGLREAGAEVTDLGLCTTSMVYFFTAEDDFDGSVMITASHNPPSDNGLKVSMRTALPVGYANGLNEVEKLVASDDSTYEPTPSSTPSVPSPDHLARYLSWQQSHGIALTQTPKTPNTQTPALRYAVDCSNGMSSLLAHALFPNAVFLNDTMDGTFPNHSPNPLTASAREQLAQVVRDQHLDCGVIFDGDADRAMFVDETGSFVQPDYLIPIVARATIGSNQSSIFNLQCSTSQHLNISTPQHLKIIHDVRTSRGAIEAIREMGCEPVMVPVGHAFAKPILREIKAVCGGELAGHYYFSEFFGCDSGILAALRVLGEVAKAKIEGKTFSQMMAPITSRYANSGELNFKVEDKEGAILRVLAVSCELSQEISRSTMDGIRIEYAEGWINVRKSNTEPYLRLLVECDTKERLADWTERLRKAIELS